MLDAPQAAIELPLGVDWRTTRFLSVIDETTVAPATVVLPTGEIRRRDAPEVSSPEEADAICAESQFMQGFAVEQPDVVQGPVNIDAQYWVSVSRRVDHSHSQTAMNHCGGPNRAAFRPVSSGSERQPCTKMRWSGIYTSTGYNDNFGMWWRLIDLNEGSLYPKPWQVWHLNVRNNARVLEVATAKDWAQFVLTYAMRDGQFLYPDWRQVIMDWEGIHMTANAICAAHGMSLRSHGELIAAPYWEVESTLWLDWVFEGSPSCVETSESATLS
jgi:hypothetical protein